ncbi:MAG: ThuA domain-containing protein [Oscillospiraceae bacterium]|nr:ThuA domain-containing protein [Oscillospiraceae bacterium]
MSEKIRVTMYNEYLEELHDANCAKVYPKGLHGAIGDYLAKNPEIEFTAVTMEMPNCGFTDELLNNTDVLLWWGHGHHGEVPDEVANKVQRRVLNGMGFVPLHSAHMSKPFMRLMGTSCRLHWCDDEKEVMWTVTPSHPIAKDVPEYFVIDSEEMYGEPFGIPNPDEVVFIGWFNHGSVFRSGVTFRRGNGKIFYFQPGHNSNPGYYNPHVLKIIENAIYWAKPDFIVPNREDYFGKDVIKI